MCEQYIVDVFDYETIIVNKEFIKCVRELYGVDLVPRPFGEYYSVTLDSLPISIREKLTKIIAPKASQIEKEVKQIARALEEKEKKRVPLKREKVEIVLKIEWDLDGLFGGPRRVISISLPQDVIDELDRVAKKLGVSRSELVYRAVASFLSAFKRYEDKLP